MLFKESYPTLKENLQLVFRIRKYRSLFYAVFILMLFLFSYFTDNAVIRGNLGEMYYITNVIAQALVSFLFALFIPLSIYKIRAFSDPSLKEHSASFLGSFLSILVAGCPACSVSIASYLGLASIVSFLPWYGLELKLLGIGLLVYALYSTLMKLQVCNIRQKTKLK
jgi:hypothetical protein